MLRQRSAARHAAGHLPALQRPGRGHRQNQGFFRMQQTCRACGGRGVVITDPCPTCQRPGPDRGQTAPSKSTSRRAWIPARASAVRAKARPATRATARRSVLRDPRPRAPAVPAATATDLICQVPITFSQAALGGEIEVPTLDGRLKPDLEARHPERRGRSHQRARACRAYERRT